MKRIVCTSLLLCAFLSGCMGPIDGQSPVNPQVGRKVVAAVIEDTLKRDKDSPQADYKFLKGLGCQFRIIDMRDPLAQKFKVQSDREGVPALVVYDAEPDPAKRQNRVRYSGKLPGKTEIQRIIKESAQ